MYQHFLEVKKMRVKVITESGKKYEFICINDRIYFCRGISCAGEVVSISEPIEVGKPIDLKFVKEGLYGKPQEESMFLKSTPVKEISVYLK